MDTLLQKLFAQTELVPESADLALIGSLSARHVNLGTARITAAAQDPSCSLIVDAALHWAQKNVGKGSNRKLVAMRAVERLSVEFARAIAERIQGYVTVELDARLAYQKRATIDKAREQVQQLEELGVSKERVIVKLPATLEGLEAAQVLRAKSDIRCQMTFVFGVHQVAASADAGAHSISPPVGRISDWHKQNGGAATGHDDPGVLAVWSMRDYLRTYSYDTFVMPCTFRGIEQVLALAGIEAMSLPSALIDELRSRHDDLPPLSSRIAEAQEVRERLTVDAATFNRLHAADPIASSKLQEGVRNLGFAAVSQQQQLGDWIAKRQDAGAERALLAYFQVWDYDGDGYIDREEWNGTEIVFNALDRDKDGRISVDELALGLGAPPRSQEP